MIRSNKTLIFFFSLILVFNCGTAQNLFQPENLKKFAGYLQNTRQYNLAASEYERIISLNPSDSGIYYELVKTYRLGNDCQNSFKTLESLKINQFFVQPQIVSEYLKLALTCNCSFSIPLFSDAISLLDKKEQVFYRMGFYLNSENRDSIIYFSANNADILNQHYPGIFSTATDIQNLKMKSPFVAASMSALFPGSGKAYSGYWGDALMSLAFVSSNMWLSYQGFKKKGTSSATGWIFGSLSFGFYVGNIWGSAKAAKNRNNAAYNKLYNEAKIDYNNYF